MFNLSYSFVMPPTVLIVVCLAAALLALRCRRAGIALMLGGSVLLYLSSLPALSGLLMRRIEAEIPRGPDPRPAQAIVILGGDLNVGSGAEVPDTLGPLTLQRLAYAARLYRLVGLPVAVSGGRIGGSAAPLGALMREALRQDFGVPVAWSEERSQTTYENALLTARLLKPANITSVFVVTQAWHMPRALWSFEHVGLHAIAWPTPRLAERPPAVSDLLPSAGAFAQTFVALHEMLGLAYYRLRY
jgi:uncharacterized SAM-binding protein YcdF (DUF218 family)